VYRRIVTPVAFICSKRRCKYRLFSVRPSLRLSFCQLSASCPNGSTYRPAINLATAQCYTHELEKSRILDVLSQFWAFWQMWADFQNNFTRIWINVLCIH